MAYENKDRLQVCYCLSERKINKFFFNECFQYCDELNVNLFPFDFETDEHPPCDVLFQRAAELTVEKDEGSLEAQKKLNTLQKYIDENPQVVVIDSIPAMTRMLDRSLFINLQKFLNEQKTKIITTPLVLKVSSVDETLKKIKEEKMAYPFICKPILGCGDGDSRKMAIVFNETHIKEIFEKNDVFILQEFRNHGGVLFKIFVLGSLHYSIIRPSIKNLDSNTENVIYFDSCDISKTNSKSPLNNQDSASSCGLSLDTKKIDDIIALLSPFLESTLYGLDIIVDDVDGHYSVVDINYLPGYIGVPEFHKILLQHFIVEYEKRKRI